MGNISDIFEKIIVDGREIDLSSLVLLNGNLNIGLQKNVNVEYIFKDESQIPSGLFKNLKQLKYAYFPKAGNIKTIGEQAFANSNLSYINTLSDVNYIGSQAFSYTKLTYVYNGDAPSSIAANAWSYISTLDNDFKETLRRKYPYIDFGINDEVDPTNPGEGGEQGGEHGEEEITSYNYTILNCDFNNNETLFVQQKDPNGANRTTITNTDNVLTLTNASNSSNGNACAKYDFSNYINENTYKVNIEFDLKLTDQTPLYHNMFTLGDKDLREQTIKDYNYNGAIFNIGTRRGKWEGTGSTVNYFTINNKYIIFSSQDGYDALVNNWLHIKVSVNLQQKTISYKIINKSNAEILYNESNINYVDENANILNIIDYNSCINNSSNYIDNLLIEKETYTEEENQPSGGEQGGESGGSEGGQESGGNQGGGQESDEESQFTETNILNCTFDNQEIYFEKTGGAGGAIRITSIENINVDNNNVLAFTNSNSANRTGSAVGVYNFGYLLTNFDTLYKIKFDIKLTSTQPTFSNMFTIGDINYRERVATNYSTNGAIFSIGTRRGKWLGTSTTVNYFTINEQYLKFEQQDGYSKLVDNWLHVEVLINLANKTLNYKVQTQDLSEILYEAKNVNFLDQTNNITLNEIDYDSSIADGINYLDNLIISKLTN